MTAPMLPVGQKMRRAADGHETEVLASGEDWAIVRHKTSGPCLLHANERGHVFDGKGLRWVPVVEPATWDVRHLAQDTFTVIATQKRDPDAWAVQIDSDYLPGNVDGDDLAHHIAAVLEQWDEFHLFHLLFAAEHREAQTAREATS